jgi:transposase
MIVIGVDVHKQSLTAVAVDEVGRAVAELTVGSSAELVSWSGSLDPERLWAVEDCRQLTGALERRLLAAGEPLVRVPPKLMAPERRAGRARGKSDPIDALAVARAALREPRLDRPRPGKAALRELKLLVDHRDDLVDERRRSQQRLRWQLRDLDPELTVPPGALDRPLWLDRVARRLGRAEQTVQARIARELAGRCRGLTRTILALDRELEARIDHAAPALLALPGCGPLSAAKLLGEIGPIERSSGASRAARAGECAAARSTRTRPSPTRPARSAAPSVGSTSTSRSTTTAVSRTRRSFRMKKEPPWPASRVERSPSTNDTGSRSKRCSPTTVAR